jgi:pyridoxine 4-dehydrogenase
VIPFAHGPSAVRLGDLTVKRLGFGAMQLPGPGVWGEPRDPAGARAVVARVLELGIELIDTSWYYGPRVANRILAEVLYPYPPHLVIATKLGGNRTADGGWGIALRPDELRAGCDEDLRLLRRERLDVVHLRWTRGADVPFLEALDAMLGLRAEGKIRHVALSNVTLAQLECALARAPIVAVSNLYNVWAGERRLAGRVDSLVADQERIVDLCAEREIAFLPYYSLATPQRTLEPSPELDAIARRHGVPASRVALAWLLARSPTMLPIPGTASVRHLEDNWSARLLALSADECAEIAAARGP